MCRARADHGLELIPVDLLGHDRGAVAYQVGYLLDGDSAIIQIDTNKWRSSRGVRLAPSPAAFVMRHIGASPKRASP